MDVLANYSIFQELQLVHDTGYFSAMPSLEENWQQVGTSPRFFLNFSSSSSTFFPSTPSFSISTEVLRVGRAHTCTHTRARFSVFI